MCKAMPKDTGYRWVWTGKSGNTAGKPKRARSSTGPSWLYELEVTLLDSEPAIWRRFTVPSTLQLTQLHEALLAVMGWHGTHVFEFIVDGTHYSDPELDDEGEMSDAAGIRLNDALTRGDGVLQYIYDWGDYWQHVVKQIDFRPRKSGEAVAKILDGARACPPEDVGGIGGYRDFLTAVTNPDHPEHQDSLEWAGGPWDAEHFDRAEAQRRLTAAARRGRWASS